MDIRDGVLFLDYSVRRLILWIIRVNSFCLDYIQQFDLLEYVLLCMTQCKHSLGLQFCGLPYSIASYVTRFGNHLTVVI